MKAALVLLALSSLVALSFAGEYEKDLRDLIKRHYKHPAGRRALECRNLNEECNLVPTCCGELQCYWENGYSMITSGVCVECVNGGLKCREDENCCGALVCYKSEWGSTEGDCISKRANGADCHRDNDCQSGDCDKPWYDPFSLGNCV